MQPTSENQKGLGYDAWQALIALIRPGKLEDARQILAANWHLNAPPHANTTPRIAFLRYLIALLESQPDTPFLGQIHPAHV